LAVEDKNALVEDLAARHGERLHRFLRSRVRNSADIPDIIQEVFLRLLRVPNHTHHVALQHTLKSAPGRVSVELSEVLSELRAVTEGDPALEVSAEQCLNPDILAAPGAKPGFQPVYLSAGEQVTLTREVPPKPVRANVSAATAWTQHQLVLESAPLNDVAEEFNRYSTRKLVVEDSGNHPLRLSGVFSTDPDFLIRYLRDRPDITVHETDSEIYISHHD
jgi:hypothetical protein